MKYVLTLFLLLSFLAIHLSFPVSVSADDLDQTVVADSTDTGDEEDETIYPMPDDSDDEEED